MGQDKLSHINAQGQAHMVDVSDKASTMRHAIASAKVLLSDKIFEMLQAGQTPKGDVLATARIAGIMAAKKTAQLIPLCHPLPLTKVTVDIALEVSPPLARITAQVKTQGQTGVEMEALTAASTAALTLYDMLKAVDKGMVITDVQLLEKHGGKSGHWQRNR